MRPGWRPAAAALLLGLLLPAGGSLAAMSECQTHCETTHKYCISDKKMSQRACLAQLEKCRQTCDKKAEKELAK